MPRIYEYVCKVCTNPFQSSTKMRKACSVKCGSALGRMNQPRLIRDISCKHCNEPFQRNTSRTKFCSLRCASSHYQRSKNHFALSRICACGNKKDKYAIFCRPCRDANSFHKSGLQTVGESKQKKGPYVHVATRNHAQSVMKFYKIPRKCVVCSYDTYVEVAHVKPIASFPLDTLLKVVNDLQNLAHLCPNHHKEFDKNLMKYEYREIVLRGSAHLAFTKLDALESRLKGLICSQEHLL